jgi:hypothetical protein
MVLVLSSFILLGGGGLILTLFQVSASAERRSAIARRAAQFDLRSPAEGEPDYPTIPSDANLTNSPGVKLRYRLPLIHSTTWRLIFGSTFCVIFSVSAAVLITLAVNSHVQGQPDWFLTIFTIPFAGIGAYAIYDFARQLLLHTGIGPTNVEISDHPLRPSWKYALYLSQSGRLTIRTLVLRLVCEEAATYRQGTDVRTEIHRTFDRQIYRKTDFCIEPGMPFETDCGLEIPESAMHSFQSEHNAINWKLVVRVEADAWPPFERCFPVIVRPAHDSYSTADRTADRVAYR